MCIICLEIQKEVMKPNELRRAIVELLSATKYKEETEHLCELYLAIQDDENRLEYGDYVDFFKNSY